MIYVKNVKTGRTAYSPDDVEIPEDWVKVETLLCTWCGKNPISDEFADWYLTLIYGYRYCSHECRREHIEHRSKPQ